MTEIQKFWGAVVAMVAVAAGGIFVVQGYSGSSTEVVEYPDYRGFEPSRDDSRETRDVNDLIWEATKKSNGGEVPNDYSRAGSVVRMTGYLLFDDGETPLTLRESFIRTGSPWRSISITQTKDPKSPGLHGLINTTEHHLLGRCSVLETYHFKRGDFVSFEAKTMRGKSTWDAEGKEVDIQPTKFFPFNMKKLKDWHSSASKEEVEEEEKK